MKIVVVVITIVAMLAFGAFYQFQSANASNLQNSTINSPIQHLIVIMQENHSFDNYFGKYPGVKDPLTSNICIKNSKGGCVKPFQLTSATTADLSHDFPYAYADWNQGKMNNFVVGEGSRGTMGYYTNATIPNYWMYANQYVLDDEFFSSILGYSLPNHWLAVAGDAPACGIYTHCVHYNPAVYLQEAQGIPTIADVLYKSNVTWKYYDYVIGTNYTKAVMLAEKGHGVGGIPTNCYETACAHWNPFAAQSRSYTVTNSSHFVENTQIFSDINKNALPNVSYIIPNDNVSEHPPR
jgi:phospholipase C